MIWKNVRERKGLYMGLTHFDENGKAVMVDVTDKKETAREAVAEGKILVNRDAVSYTHLVIFKKRIRRK